MGGGVTGRVAVISSTPGRVVLGGATGRVAVISSTPGRVVLGGATGRVAVISSTPGRVVSAGLGTRLAGRGRFEKGLRLESLRRLECGDLGVLNTPPGLRLSETSNVACVKNK